MKFESLEEDFGCVQELLRLDPKTAPNPAALQAPRLEDVVKTQFRTLSKTQIRALYELYKFDFIAFEYDYESFLALGTNV